MGYIMDGLVRMFKGDIVDQKTQEINWTKDTATYTSAFMQSVVLFAAREFSKLEIKHRVYVKQKDGGYLTKDKLGSSEFEVLNFASNGFKTNAEWKREIAKRLLMGSNVYLKPKRVKGLLVALEFTTLDDYNKNKADIVVITSPVAVSKNAPLYDNILTNIGNALESNKLRGFLKINAAINSQSRSFKEVASEQLKLMQEVASFNGLGVLDGKSELIELKNEYNTVSSEAVDIIKREILNGFGFSESLLTGSYSEDDYRHFFDNVLSPIILEIQKELTYKLLTNNARINNGVKNTFERLIISRDIFKFANVDQLIQLSAANTNGAYLTVNEVRQLMGFDPVEGGDVFRSNLNSVEVEYNAE